jgi:hypothetical protein
MKVTQNYSNFIPVSYLKPVTVAVQSKAWTVFARSNARIMGSNPTQDMVVCLCLFCVCIGSGLSRGWSPIQGGLPTLLGLRNSSETKRFTDALCSKVRATGKREREREAIWKDQKRRRSFVGATNDVGNRDSWALSKINDQYSCLFLTDISDWKLYLFLHSSKLQKHAELWSLQNIGNS